MIRYSLNKYYRVIKVSRLVNVEIDDYAGFCTADRSVQAIKNS
jgi:hypothetical protein